MGIGSGPKPKVSGFYTDIHRKDYNFQGYESWIDNLLEECCQDIQSLLVIWKRKNWLIVRTQKLFQIQCFKRKIFTSAPRKEKVMHGCTNRVIWTGRFAPETRWEILYSAGVTHKERLRCTYRVDRQIKKLRSFFAYLKILMVNFLFISSLMGVRWAIKASVAISFICT